ncbi:MAG: DEAD/DEAH box helicase [Desulfurococcales archaeon]|nr:DEAD/DEAH box helicase [Desulfurococcales archaeon]
MATDESGAIKLLDTRLVKVARKLGYTSLLPVQEKSIPVILRGYNTLIVAPTGSGKTEAALLPILTLMLKCRDRGECDEGVVLVYVTPLRALNRDIESRIKRLVEATGFSVMVRHGDTTQSLRKKFAAKPPHVMITTPESLNLLLTVKNLRKYWSNVRWVVVDELHEFIDSERGSELAVIIERLQRFSKYRIQRIALSATLSERTIREHAVKLLAGRRHVEVVVDPSPKEYDIRVSSVEEGEKFWSEAAKRVAEIASGVRGKVLVFVNTRATAEMLASEISKYTEHKVAVHHGSLSRMVREEAERGFKEGDIKILVATSSMELGVDIGSVDLVIQFLSPRSVITMTQRAGRAGHRFGETSRAVIVTSNNLFELLESSVIASRAEVNALEDLKIHFNPLDALAHQVTGIVLEDREVSAGFIYSFLTKTAPFQYLGVEDLEETIEHLEGVRVLRVSPEGNLRLGSRAFRYFYKVSMIPSENNYIVYDIISGSKVGELGERFVEARLLKSSDKGKFYFILAGRVWQALDIDVERSKIEAKPVGVPQAHIPSWEGELIPVDYKVAREVCSIMSLCMSDPEGCARLLKSRKLEEKDIERIINIVQGTVEKWMGHKLGPFTPVVEESQSYTVLFTCLGSKGNFALATLLSQVLHNHFRVSVLFDYIPYAIVFRGPAKPPGRLIKKALEVASEMSGIQRRFLAESAVRESDAFTLRFIQVAKRMGVIDPDKGVSWEMAKKIKNAYRGSVVEREALREIIYDKLDFNALNTFLDNIREISVVSGPSPLSEEVLLNPYMRRDKAIDLKSVALDTLIESHRRRLRLKTVVLLCTTCGSTWRRSASSIGAEFACPKCGSRMIAVLPDSEWGRKAVEVFREYKKGKRMRGEKAKLVSEILARARLFVEYYREGLIPRVVEALSSYGVGPTRARRILSALVDRGEKAYYKELFKAVEEYASNRRFWKSERRSARP